MNIIAVVTGVACGLLVTVVSQLLLGPDASVVGGAIVAASVAASGVTRAMK